MLIAVCADKGAPGATSTALALGASWPNPVALVEADASGGDLGLRLRTSGGVPLPRTPTVLSVASGAHSQHGNREQWTRTAVAFSGQMVVVPGYLTAEQGSGLSQLWQPLAQAFAATSMDVIVDLGRLNASSPAMGIAAAADAVVVVARPELGSVVHLRERLQQLSVQLGRARGRAPILYPVLVTTHRHADAQVREVDEVLAAVGTVTQPTRAIAWDPPALERLEQADDPSRRLGRSLLIRTAREVAGVIHGYAGAEYTQGRRRSGPEEAA